MKKLFTLLAALLLLTFHAPAQTIHRVTAGMNLQTVIDAAVSGDIFLVEAGIARTNLDLDKKVTIIGTGHFLTATQQASPGVSQVDHIRLKPGSDGSYIAGMQCLTIVISANNIVIKRCYATNDIALGYTGIAYTGGDWSGTVNNCLITQNYVPRLNIINQNAPNATAHNFIVSNNIFFRYGFHLEGNVSGSIINNTFMPGIGSEEYYHSLQTSANGNHICKVLPVVFRNNIMPKILQAICPINVYPTADFQGNVFTQDFTNLPSGNVINANPDELFVGYPTNPGNALSPDARAQLGPNSAAKGAGVGGTDAGAFGGTDPYVLGGLPEIPSIYQLTVPQSVSQGGTLQVQIKAKTGN